MPTSVGDPTTNQRPNTPSTPQDAQIRITTGQNQLTGRPCPTTLHDSRVTPTELPGVLQIEEVARNRPRPWGLLAPPSWAGTGERGIHVFYGRDHVSRLP